MQVMGGIVGSLDGTGISQPNIGTAIMTVGLYTGLHIRFTSDYSTSPYSDDDSPNFAEQSNFTLSVYESDADIPKLSVKTSMVIGGTSLRPVMRLATTALVTALSQPWQARTISTSRCWTTV